MEKNQIPKLILSWPPTSQNIGSYDPRAKAALTIAGGVFPPIKLIFALYSCEQLYTPNLGDAQALEQELFAVFAMKKTSLVQNPVQASKISETYKLRHILPAHKETVLPGADGNRQCMFC